MFIRSDPQVLEVNWVRPMYTVSASTIRLDKRRHCWICHQSFVIGEELSIVFTREGQKYVHSRCLPEGLYELVLESD